MKEQIEAKLQDWTKKREELVKNLQELDSQYKLGVRNLDAIDGAIFILKEQLADLEPKKEVKNIEVSLDIETEKESKH